MERNVIACATMALFALGIAAFSMGMLRYHLTRRESCRYDLEFDRARARAIRGPGILGGVCLALGILAMLVRRLV